MTETYDSGRIRRPLPLAAPLLAAALLLSGCGYGEIRELDEQAAEARSDIEVQLQRQADLIPTLRETIQRHDRVDAAVIEAVADSRVALIAALRTRNMSRIEAASGALSRAVGELLAAVSGLEALQADPGFRRLRAEFHATESVVAEAGQTYNEAVRRYNEYIDGFPQILTAKVLGAEPRELYESAALEEDPPSADR